MVFKRTFLLLLALVLIIAGLKSPMLFIFPMWIFVYLKKDFLSSRLKKFSLPISFIGAGLFFGLLTEVFAVIGNLSKPPEQRILLSPNPSLDLIYGLFYYFFFMAAWYLLLRKMRYSKKELFFIAGVFGIITEETGRVFSQIFISPAVGISYALLVMLVYGIFPMLALLLTEKRFSGKKTTWFKRYFLAALVLFIQYAIYGLFFLPMLKKIFA